MKEHKAVCDCGAHCTDAVSASSPVCVHQTEKVIKVRHNVASRVSEAQAGTAGRQGLGVRDDVPARFCIMKLN